MTNSAAVTVAILLAASDAEAWPGFPTTSPCKLPAQRPHWPVNRSSSRNLHRTPAQPRRESHAHHREVGNEKLQPAQATRRRPRDEARRAHGQDVHRRRPPAGGDPSGRQSPRRTSRQHPSGQRQNVSGCSEFDVACDGQTIVGAGRGNAPTMFIEKIAKRDPKSRWVDADYYDSAGFDPGLLGGELANRQVALNREILGASGKRCSTSSPSPT